MKVELSKSLVDIGGDLPFPCLIARGTYVLLVRNNYDPGIVISSSDSYEIGEEIHTDGGTWQEEGWVLYDGTVTLSNK